MYKNLKKLIYYPETIKKYASENKLDIKPKE